MKVVLPLIFTLFSGYANASDYFCEVGKSLIVHNPETNEIINRQAKTEKFLVTLDEHEDQKHLDFFEEDGTHWGKVTVSTGTYETDLGDAFYANAITTDLSGNITSFLTVKMPKTASESSASTMILGAENGLNPTLSVSCFAVAIN